MMGILEDVLGSVLGGQQRGGGMQGGGMQSGLPGGLGGMLGGGSQGGMSPIMMALMTLLTQQMSGRGGSGMGGGLGGGMGGGFGDLLGGLTGGGQIGGSGQIQQPDRSEQRHEDASEVSLGNRGEFNGGHTGFDGLLEKLERGGQGQKAKSWVSHEQNEPIAPHELQTALGDDTVDQLATQTGMPKGDLLSQLSELLPGVIDKLTPNGRLPDRQERQGW
jgi:uncharacterized protein YidB (DUF937 family)